MLMTVPEQLLTIGVVVLATMATRFLPFLLFPAGKQTPPFVRYLGRVLPAAVFGMLVVYCFKGVSVTASPHGLPELIASALVVVLHVLFRNTLVSILGGTATYMLLVQLVF